MKIGPIRFKRHKFRTRYFGVAVNADREICRICIDIGRSLFVINWND